MWLIKKSILTFLVFVLLISGFSISSFALDKSQAKKIDKVLGERMGIDDSLYEVKFAENHGRQFILATIVVNEETIEGFSDQNVRETLSRFLSKPAIYVSVLAPSAESTFNPYDLLLKQENDSWAVKSAVDLTEGFKEGKMAKNLGNGKWASRGIVVFPEKVDTSVTFSLKFGSSLLKLNPLPPTKPAEEVSEVSREVKDEECETCQPETFQQEEQEEKETSPEKEEVEKPSGAEGGMALGFNGLILALLTLSLL